jgi:hypothetical protein
VPNRGTNFVNSRHRHVVLVHRNLLRVGASPMTRYRSAIRESAKKGYKDGEPSPSVSENS